MTFIFLLRFWEKYCWSCKFFLTSPDKESKSFDAVVHVHGLPTSSGDTIPIIENKSHQNSTFSLSAKVPQTYRMAFEQLTVWRNTGLYAWLRIGKKNWNISSSEPIWFPFLTVHVSIYIIVHKKCSSFTLFVIPFQRNTSW